MTLRSGNAFVALHAAAVLATIAAGSVDAAESRGPVLPSSSQPAVALTRSLDECLSLALQNNRRRPASRFAVARR